MPDLSKLKNYATKVDKAAKEINLNERGFTPFQFSSRKTQMNTTQLGGLLPNNPISDLLNESMSWYEMWINPQKVNIARQYLQKPNHTAGSIVTFHYRPDVYNMSVEGTCGWIMKAPYEQGPNNLGFKKNKDNKWKVWNKDKFMSDSTQSNSPRIFLQRIRDIANEPMYFVDLNGIEHYNIKYLKIYTKQYPHGIICEGYYKKFDIPESGEDAQTIDYKFDFTIESMKPITALQKMAGMFGAAKGLGTVGSGIRSIPGLG